MGKTVWRLPNGDIIDTNAYDPTIWGGKPRTGVKEAIQALIREDQNRPQPLLQKKGDNTGASLSGGGRPRQVAFPNGEGYVQLDGLLFESIPTSSGYKLRVEGEVSGSAATFTLSNQSPRWIRIADKRGNLFPVRVFVGTSGTTILEGAVGQAPIVSCD
jgi:hypothetical protein